MGEEMVGVVCAMCLEDMALLEDEYIVLGSVGGESRDAKEWLSHTGVAGTYQCGCGSRVLLTERGHGGVPEGMLICRTCLTCMVEQGVETVGDRVLVVLLCPECGFGVYAPPGGRDQ